jgi:hypothetical protein
VSPEASSNRTSGDRGISEVQMRDMCAVQAASCRGCARTGQGPCSGAIESQGAWSWPRAQLAGWRCKSPVTVIWRRGACGGYAHRGLRLIRPCMTCPRGRLTGGAVISPVPRAAAGLCGWPGAFAVRPARPAALPWPAQRTAAPGAAAGPVPACRGAGHRRPGGQRVGACARDSPPFCAVDGWEGAARGRAGGMGPAPWPRRPGRCPC